MSDAPHSQPAPAAAEVARRRRISLIWAIPVISALIGGWLAWDTYSKRGPTITITFETAEGLQAGQSHVRHKDVDMGLVTGIALTPDLSRVNITIEMTREAVPLLTDKTIFWVVKPRFFAGNFSGIETVLSGSYIAMLPSSDRGEPARHFVGREDPPVLQSDVPGTVFLLKADRIGSISVGSPISFRDFSVGEILGWDIGDMAESVTLHAFIRAPFDKYVNASTRFWNASGISVKLGAEGVQVQLDSLRALVLGGVSFETPKTDQATPVSADNLTFPLYADREAADAAAYTREVEAVAYFSGSVRGLAVGAPVTLRGLRIGHVTSVALTYDPKLDNIVVPVHFVVEPGRVAQSEIAYEKNGTQKNAAAMIARGLRAQLGSANLLTGQMLVALDFDPTAAPAQLRMEGDIIVVPTVPGEFDSLLASASELMAKVNNLPFADIGKNLNQTLAGLNQITNGPELRQSLVSLQGTLAAAEDTVKRVNVGITPALKELPGIAASLQEAVNHANHLMASADASYGNGSNFNRNLERLLSQLNDTAQSVRVLADLLTRHPEALVRGRTDQGLQ